MNPQHPTALTVSVADAAQLTSFSQYEIRKAINAGELPAIKRGVRLAIFVTDLTAWLQSLPKAVDPADVSA